MKNREIKFRCWENIRKMMFNDLRVIHLSQEEEYGTILMQFTGAKDKDGVEIFDGDIVEGEFENEFGSVIEGKAEVGWCEHNNNWAIYPKPNIPKSEHFMLIHTKDLKVVGNRFENPGLLI